MAPFGVLQSLTTRAPEIPNAPGGVQSPDDWHWKARRALLRFGTRAVPALVDALSGGDDPTVRRLAAESLGRLGHEARGASDALRHAALHDGDRTVRAAAAVALETITAAGPA